MRFIDAFVSGLDLVEAGFARVEPKATGRPGYAPGVLLKFYIHCCLNRVLSSRPASSNEADIRRVHFAATDPSCQSSSIASAAPAHRGAPISAILENASGLPLQANLQRCSSRGGGPPIFAFPTFARSRTSLRPRRVGSSLRYMGERAPNCPSPICRIATKWHRFSRNLISCRRHKREN